MNVSRLASIIERLEANQPVDWNREALLQAFEVARVGELYVEDTEQRQREADEQLAAQLNGG